MKRKITIFAIAMLMLLTVALPQMNTNADEATKSVDIMFLHDTHSHLNTFATVEGTESVIMGGFPELRP